MKEKVSSNEGNRMLALTKDALTDIHDCNYKPISPGYITD